MPTIQITFDDKVKKSSDYADVRISNNKGVEMDHFKMTLDDVVMAISDSTFDMFTKKALPTLFAKSSMLPQNCIGYAQQLKPVPVVGQEPQNYETAVDTYWIEIPKNQWDIMVYNTLFIEVGFPRMLIGYSVEKASGRVSIKGLFALKNTGQRIKEDDQVYKFPFSNVSNGKICIGSSSIPLIQHPDELTDFHRRTLFTGSFTSDLYVNRNLSGIDTVRELAHALSEKAFPEEWLAEKKFLVRDLLK